MLKTIGHKVNSFVKGIGGFKGFIFINIAILILILILMFIQQNWIRKEANAIKSVMNSRNELESVKEIDSLKEYKKLLIENVIVKKYINVSNNSLHTKKEQTFNVRKMVKEADLFYEYEQYEKALRIYEMLINRNSSFDERDRIFSRLAECYFNLEDFEKALKVYRKVYNDYVKSPYSLSARLGAGKCLILMGNYGEARRVLSLLVAQEAKYKNAEDKTKVIEAYYKIADSYIEQAKVYLSKNDNK